VHLLVLIHALFLLCLALESHFFHPRIFVHACFLDAPLPQLIQSLSTFLLSSLQSLPIASRGF
jgi:hypothetical protein